LLSNTTEAVSIPANENSLLRTADDEAAVQRTSTTCSQRMVVKLQLLILGYICTVREWKNGFGRMNESTVIMIMSIIVVFVYLENKGEEDSRMNLL
jgi:hypothetical protein